MNAPKPLPKVPTNAWTLALPIRGTLILILWQRAFAWPTWVYAVLWTLWSFVWAAAIYDRLMATPISDDRWREVFK